MQVYAFSIYFSILYCANFLLIHNVYIQGTRWLTVTPTHRMALSLALSVRCLSRVQGITVSKHVRERDEAEARHVFEVRVTPTRKGREKVGEDTRGTCFNIMQL